MTETKTITEAKARLSEFIGRLIHRGDKLFITKKGKVVAVFLPIESYRDLAQSEGRSLLKARAALADLDSEVDKMCRDIYNERENERDRQVIF